MKGYAAGVVLATGIVHMLGDGLTTITQAYPTVDFPIGPAIVLAAVLFTLTIEQSAAMFFDNVDEAGPNDVGHRMHTHHLDGLEGVDRQEKDLEMGLVASSGLGARSAASSSGSSGGAGSHGSNFASVEMVQPQVHGVPLPAAQLITPAPWDPSTLSSSSSPSHVTAAGVMTTTATEGGVVSGTVGGGGDLHRHPSQNPMLPMKLDEKKMHHHHDSHHHHLEGHSGGHGHAHSRHSREFREPGGGHGHSHGGHLLEIAKMGGDKRKIIVAHVLELGIAFHSVIIGITLGVTVHAGELNALIAAISFHQFFEGFALGAAVLAAKMKNRTYIYLMSIIFAITTPTGIAIGVGISSTYNQNSETALITEGVFDCISAGILIYMALVDLVSEEFRDLMTHQSHMRVHMLLAIAFGSGCMTILALWA